MVIEQALLLRIAARAHDPERSSDMAAAMTKASPIEINSLLSDLQRNDAPSVRGLLAAFGKLGGKSAGADTSSMERAPEARPEPVREPDFAAFYAEFGFTLPHELRQLYGISNGGFGPGTGLFSIADLQDRYREVTSPGFTPAEQSWPQELLPFINEDPVLICLDIRSGHVVAWDPEEIEDEDNSAHWRASFKPEFESLAAFWEAWLDRPTLSEVALAGLKSLTFEVPQATIDYYASLSPQQRAEMGFPGDDWEDQVRRELGQAMSFPFKT